VVSSVLEGGCGDEETPKISNKGVKRKTVTAKRAIAMTTEAGTRSFLILNFLEIFTGTVGLFSGCVISVVGMPFSILLNSERSSFTL
jgi:hypothetical protein